MHPFKVSVITEKYTQGNPNDSAGTNNGSKEGSSNIMGNIVSSINDQRAPTIYEVSFSTENISVPFLKVYKDKYKSEEGNESRINLGMKLPKDIEAIQKPEYVNVQWENNRILFSFIKQEDIPNEFSITMKTVEEENPNNPVNIIFNCKLKQ